MTRAKKPKAKRAPRRKSAPRATQPASATPGPPPASFDEIGEPPDDPLEANAALHRMLVLSAYDAAKDPKLSPRERRLELRTITAAAAKLMPDSRRWQAEELIKEDRRLLEQKAADRRGAKLEARPRRDAAK